jgi:D-glycero-alpha-D-manno-heptose 1-phosphate guanylyltransferase
MNPGAATVILLAGGMGRRVRHLYPNLPKPMIPVDGEPFLEWAIRYWLKQGIRSIVVSTGYRAAIIEKFLASRRRDSGLIVSAAEPQPLGTGGAVRFAADIRPASDPLIVANGDSLAILDLAAVWPMLVPPDVDGLIISVAVDDTSRYGSLQIGPDDRLVGFCEKQSGRGYVNAGVYVLKRRMLTMFPDRSPLSMETEVFPTLLQAGAEFRVVRTAAPFLDIGTPASLALAEEFIRRNQNAFATAAA